MDWEGLGFNDNPLDTDPIKQKTLSLYVGHDKEVRICSKVLADKNVNLIIEGARGVGTTSFANLMRFKAQEKDIAESPVSPNQLAELIMRIKNGALSSKMAK